MYLGSDEVEASAATEGRCTGNLFQNNRIETSTLGVMMRDTRDTMMIGNSFTDADKNEWENSDGLLWKVNGGPVSVHVDRCIPLAHGYALV